MTDTHTPLMTIERFIHEQQKQFPSATGQFTRMLQDMAMAGKLIARETIRAGITDILGEADTTNPSGETQKRLDLMADRIIYQMNAGMGRIIAMGSEENEGLMDVSSEAGEGNYVLLYDPLDGSSNIDVNVSVGTIFSIHRKFTHGKEAKLDDALQQGKRLVAAGYIAYGSSTMMVYTTGAGVHGFTLDPTIGEFILTHENITMPDPAQYYSVNYGNYNDWTHGVKAAIGWLQGDDDDSPELSMRYTGTLVGDFHRNLLKGGIYLYPHGINKTDSAGKIRLLYEAQALAFIAEQAGGYASDGIGNILDIDPHELHQRVPIFIGDKALVERVEAIVRNHDDDWTKEYLKYRDKRA